MAKMHTCETIVKEIQRVKGTLGHVPSKAEFKRETGITDDRVRRLCGSWSEAVTKAGFEAHAKHKRTDDLELMRAYGEVVRELRKVPTVVELGKKGRHSSEVYKKHFGKHSGLPAKFLKFANGTCEWDDVVGILKSAAIPGGATKAAVTASGTGGGRGPRKGGTVKHSKKPACVIG
ncbi:MAG: hypothetical protein KJ052_22310 [Candidatus Hydrogenedentes bacterium]|nr:hypothetical protein [Candidatus Hydrogenedentota bacterium]